MDKCKKHAQYWERSDVLTYMLESPVICGRTCVCVCARVCGEQLSNKHDFKPKYYLRKRLLNPDLVFRQLCVSDFLLSVVGKRSIAFVTKHLTI
jgi:hypothetical protein